MRHFNRGVGAAVLAVSLVGSTAACTSDPGGDGTGTQVAQVEGTRVAAESDGSGVETARLLVDSAPVVIVAAPDAASQARAASVAVGLHAPMLTAVEGGDAALADEVSRLSLIHI